MKHSLPLLVLTVFLLALVATQPLVLATLADAITREAQDQEEK